MTSPAFIDTGAAAQQLGLTKRHLQSLARERKIPHHRVGALVRFTADDIEAIKTQTAVKPTQAAADAKGRKAS